MAPPGMVTVARSVSEVVPVWSAARPIPSVCQTPSVAHASCADASSTSERPKEEKSASAAAPVDTGLTLENIRLRYAISGSNPPWKPLRAFDDSEKVYIQFPSGLKQGEAPPLFIIDGSGKPALVNYRVKGNTYIVDRLFAVAELRLGTKPQAIVKIIRTDAAQPKRRFLFTRNGER